MTRFDQPLLHLAEPPTRQRPTTRVHSMDVVFLISALVLVLGGALFLIDLAGAKSSGQDTTTTSQVLAEASNWMPAFLSSLAKYGMWFLASVLNSALIVGLVTLLRSVDRKVRMSRMSNRRMSRFTPLRKMQTMRRSRATAKTQRVRERPSYLLSPVSR